MITRRALLSLAGALPACSSQNPRAVVSVVRIANGNIGAAVERALDLLGGMATIAPGKDRILLKPNLVAPAVESTTKLPVVRTLVRLMRAAGKEVSIGEGSAAAPPFNVRNNRTYCTSDRELLRGLQQRVFDDLGYSELAKAEKVRLVNLHLGDLVEVKVPSALVFDKLTLHRSLLETDLLCSVPMMKTHALAGVTLGMKNLIGLFPGAVYQALRGAMHDRALRLEPSATAAPILDMLRANKLGLTVIDGSSAMEGQGPSDGVVVPMETIVAGTNPLATDMVAASVMGFGPGEISTFTWAHRIGMTPRTLDEIEIRGDSLERVRRKLARPVMVQWVPGAVPSLA